MTTTTDQRAFYAAARERLVAATDDPAALEALEHMSEAADRGEDELTDAALGAFLREAQRLGLSLDYVFCGEGEPHSDSPVLGNMLENLIALPKSDQRASPMSWSALPPRRRASGRASC